MTNLEKILKEQGRTGKWLALQMGVHYNTVYSWISGKHQPRKKAEIAKLLNVKPKDI